MPLIAEHCLDLERKKKIGAHNWRLPFTLKMSQEIQEETNGVWLLSPELTGDSRCEHQAESCSLGRSTLSTDVARAQGTPQGSGHTPGLALRESHCFIAGPENPLLGCRAKLWHHDGSAQQATWASTLPGSCSTKAHLCKSSFQTKCPLHGRSQEAYLLMAPPLWLHGSCSNLKK